MFIDRKEAREATKDLVWMVVEVDDKGVVFKREDKLRSGSEALTRLDEL